MLGACSLPMSLCWGMEEFSGRYPMTPTKVAATCLAHVCYENPKLKNTTQNWVLPTETFGGAQQKQRQNCSGGTLPFSVQHRFFWNLSGLALWLSRWYIFETIPYVQENKYILHSLLFLLSWALSQFGHYLSWCLVYFLQVSETHTDKCVLWVSSKNFCLFSSRILLYDFLTLA